MEEHVSAVKIKICGITKEEEVSFLNEAGVDYAGFVFYEKSKRNILPERANDIKSNLLPSIKSVAVTVSPDAKMVRQINDIGFDIIQIHGEITKEAIDAANSPVWVAVNAGTVDEAEEKIKAVERSLADACKKIEAYVFDAPSFGSGISSDWSDARRLDTDKKFILAGGLNSKNVAEGIKVFSPDIVDASSSVEGINGKEKDKVFEFVNAVRKGCDDE